MLRPLLIFLVIIAIAAVAGFLADQPGMVSMTWAGWRLETTTGAGIALVLIAAAVATATGFALWALRPQAWRRRGRSFRLERGIDAINQGLLAIAAGDGAEAQKWAKRADRLVGDQSRTLLLSAQAAELAGDRDRARSDFEAMLTYSKTAAMGLRGLYGEAMRRGDRDAALALARKANDLKPVPLWVHDGLYKLEAGYGDYDAAEKAVAAAIRAKAISRDHGLKARAHIQTARGYEALEAVQDDRAQTLADEALKTDPSIAAAAALVARMQLRNGREGRAQKIIELCWAHQPTKDLADLFERAVATLSPMDALKKGRALVQKNPHAGESHLLLARLALKARVFDEADDAIERAKALPGVGDSIRGLTLQADYVRLAEQDANRAGKLMAEAGKAKDAIWICGACGTPAKDWSVTCNHCADFASLTWRPSVTAAPIMDDAVTTEATENSVVGDRAMEEKAIAASSRRRRSQDDRDTGAPSGPIDVVAPDDLAPADPEAALRMNQRP